MKTRSGAVQLAAILVIVMCRSHAARVACGTAPNSSAGGRTGPRSGGGVRELRVLRQRRRADCRRCFGPRRATAVGGGVLPGLIEGVAVSGSYAYVADWVRGLRVIDVSTPASPIEVGFVDTPGSAVAWPSPAATPTSRTGDAGLRVIDVSTPASPIEVGFVDTPGTARGRGRLRQLRLRRGVGVCDGLRVIDVSTPASPIEVGFVDTPGSAMGVAVSGSYAYVADDWAGLRVIDVSDAREPHRGGLRRHPGDAPWAWPSPAATPTSRMD